MSQPLNPPPRPRTSPTPPTPTLLALLGPYLAHQLEVESPAHGRGTLLGLPWSPVWEQPVAECLFPDEPGSRDERDDCQEYRTGRLRPVLWAPEDLGLAMVDASRGRGRDLALVELLGGLGPERLQYFAQVTDAVRALGVAVGLTPSQYVRKEATK